MDWDLWIRLYKSGAKFAFLEAPMSQVLWGAETKSASLNKRRRDELRRVIGEHTPAEKQKEIFRAFAIHAIADMLWPPMLKDRVLKRLRRVGQRLYGLRADGEIADRAVLSLAHYFEGEVSGVVLELEGDLTGVSADASVPSRTIPAMDGKIGLAFDAPLPAGRALEVTLSREPGPGPRYFKRAVWVRPA